MIQLAVAEICQLHEVGDFLNWLGDLDQRFGLRNHENTTPERPTAISRRAPADLLSFSDAYSTRNDAVVHCDERRMTLRSRVKVELDASLPRGPIHQQNHRLCAGISQRRRAGSNRLVFLKAHPPGLYGTVAVQVVNVLTLFPPRDIRARARTVHT